MLKGILSKLVAVILWSAGCLPAADPFFLQRNLADLKSQPDDLTANTQTATYKPIFGVGAEDADQLVGVVRYGELTVAPGGSSAIVQYPAEEQIYYIREGNGILVYGDQRVAVQRDDFMYLPVNLKHGMDNTSQTPIRLIVMGYRIPGERHPASTPKLLRANAGEVALQVLASHGPTTQFKLLMGQTSSQRDKLAAASEMTSLFIMDFAPGGTNNPHSHRTEEEIYLLLRGSGEMVAGKTAEGQDARYPVKAGRAFFFAPGIRVGYYSHAKEGEEHDLILAVRSRLPSTGP